MEFWIGCCCCWWVFLFWSFLFCWGFFEIWVDRDWWFDFGCSFFIFVLVLFCLLGMVFCYFCGLECWILGCVGVCSFFWWILEFLGMVVGSEVVWLFCCWVLVINWECCFFWCCFLLMGLSWSMRGVGWSLGLLMRCCCIVSVGWVELGCCMCWGLLLVLLRWCCCIFCMCVWVCCCSVFMFFGVVFGSWSGYCIVLLFGGWCCCCVVCRSGRWIVVGSFWCVLGIDVKSFLVGFDFSYWFYLWFLGSFCRNVGYIVSCCVFWLFE